MADNKGFRIKKDRPKPETSYGVEEYGGSWWFECLIVTLMVATVLIGILAAIGAVL